MTYLSSKVLPINVEDNNKYNNKISLIQEHNEKNFSQNTAQSQKLNPDQLRHLFIRNNF